MLRDDKILKHRLLTGILSLTLICLGFFSFVNIPTQAVTLVPLNPLPDSIINGTVNFTVIDSDSNALFIEFWYDGEYFSDLRYDGSAVWYYEINTLALEDGPHFIQYKGFKGSGLDDVTGFAVFIDNHGPELSAFEVFYPPPQEAARWGDMVFFQIKAEDEMGISWVKLNCSSFNFTTPFGPMIDDGFHFDGQPGDDVYGSNPFGVDAMFSGLYIVNISARDFTGNIIIDSYLIEIDNMIPVVFNANITYPAGQTAAKLGDQIRVTAMAFDFGLTGGILGLEVDLSPINGSPVVQMFDDGLHGDGFEGDGMYGSDWVTVGSHANGFIPLAIDAYDLALNRNQNIALINLDNNAPTVLKIKIQYPGFKGYAEDGDRINVTATITDDQGFNALSWYYLDASEIGGSQYMANTSMFRWDGILVSVGYTRGPTSVTVHAFDHANNEGTLTTHVDVAQDIRRAPSVRVTSPNGGENWMDGDCYPITWLADGNFGPKPINLYYSIDNSETWKPIAIDLPNTGCYNWTVPPEETAGTLIRVNVTDIYGFNVSDTSDATFSIDPPPPSTNTPTNNWQPSMDSSEQNSITDAAEPNQEDVQDTHPNSPEQPERNSGSEVEEIGADSNPNDYLNIIIGVLIITGIIIISIMLMKVRKKGTIDNKNQKTRPKNIASGRMLRDK